MEMDQLEQRLTRLERSLRKWKAVTAGLVLVLVVGVTVAATREAGVVLTREEYLRLAIKDAIDWHVGLYQDRVHVKVQLQKRDNTLLVALDHPNGVDREVYKKSYVLFEDRGRAAAEEVLSRRGWQDKFKVSSSYVGKYGLGWVDP